MTRDQHLAILEFLDSTLSGGPVGIDVEADAIIRAYLKRHPDAAYHLTTRAMSLAGSQAEAVVVPAQRSWLALIPRRIFERRQADVS